MLYFMIFCSVLIGVAGQLLMKHGVSQVASGLGAVEFLIKALLSPWVLAGLFAYGIGTLIWLGILSKVEVSFAYPMLALGYIFVMFFAQIFLQEQVSLTRYLGAVLIIIGVILINRS